MSYLMHSGTVRAYGASEQDFFEIVANYNIINCTYISHFGLHTVLTMCQEGTSPLRKLFLGLSIVLLLTSSFIYFFISEGVVGHPYAIAQNCKYR